MKFDNNQRNRKLFLILIIVTISFITSSLLLLSAIKGMNALIEEQTASLNEVNTKLEEQLEAGN
ncbi:hypothetical protein R2F61_06060 [Mollicutes bacterium LVI A0078]|nr:hypothetical protein RZE84_06065 [Mollicutes bacterium LVI A0075]WOO90295.1 hypothetical protein R2F61_06060 [Mollicutes bacterium LVI A0078]